MKAHDYILWKWNTVFRVSVMSVGNVQGEWKCVANNDYGHSVTAASVKLVIPRHYKKPVFLEPLRAVLSQEGTVNLECKVSAKLWFCFNLLAML